MSVRTSTKLIIGIVISGGSGLGLFAAIALDWFGLSSLPSWVYWLGVFLTMSAAFSGTGVGPIGKRLDRLLKEGR